MDLVNSGKDLKTTAATIPADGLASFPKRAPDDADQNIVRESLEFRPVHSSDELETVYRITHDAYVSVGYITPRSDRRLAHFPHLDAVPETTIVVALLNGRIVGTSSLSLDGPAGLHVDEDFKAETDRIRAEGRRLAACYRIVTIPEYRDRQVIVMGLLKEMAARALAAGVETCLYVFHKRHERAYQVLFNMKTVAELSAIQCCNGEFHAVFMRCDCEDLPTRWIQGTPPSSKLHSTDLQGSDRQDPAKE